MSDVNELKDVKLEKVNGGTMLETMGDHKKFKELGLVSGNNGFSPGEVRKTF